MPLYFVGAFARRAGVAARHAAKTGSGGGFRGRVEPAAGGACTGARHLDLRDLRARTQRRTISRAIALRAMPLHQVAGA